jgi:hypothetical protein
MVDDHQPSTSHQLRCCGRYDGIEAPASDAKRQVGMGDYRPAAWVRTFNPMTPRDGRRCFRR